MLLKISPSNPTAAIDCASLQPMGAVISGALLTT
jgi:hypothetical protein